VRNHRSTSKQHQQNQRGTQLYAGALGDIDVKGCHPCGVGVKALTCIEQQPAIERILNYLDWKGT
jgi:hypothetical protein